MPGCDDRVAVDSPISGPAAARTPAALMRSNPFCTRFVRPGAIEYQFSADPSTRDEPTSSPATIVDELARQGAGVVVGPHGSGKSTLLQTLWPDLSARYAEIDWVQTHACDRPGLVSRWSHRRRCDVTALSRPDRLAEGGLLVVDGIEQISTACRWRLIRRLRKKRQSLLATSHRPMTGLKTLYRTEVTPRLILTLTRRLMDDAPDDLIDGVMGNLCERDLTVLKNVRELWFDLYDVVETADG